MKIILLKEIVRKKLIANGIDISKVRIIKHGDWIDIYPKEPDSITVTNKRNSTRRNKDKPIIKDGAIRLVPVTQGRHMTDIPVRLYQLDKYADDEDFDFMVETVNNYIKEV